MVKHKLTDAGFFKILEKHGNDFIDWYRTSITHKGKKVRGTLYKLDRLLTDPLRDELMTYPNVRLMMGHSEYAPEIKFHCILITDVRIWDNVEYAKRRAQSDQR